MPGVACEGWQQGVRLLFPVLNSQCTLPGRHMWQDCCCALPCSDGQPAQRNARPALHGILPLQFAFQGVAGELLPKAFGVEADVEQLIAQAAGGQSG